jgi:lipoteichoic acid synthase
VTGVKVARTRIQKWSNELIYILLLLKIILFHFYSDSTISSGALSTSAGFLLLFYASSFLFRNKGRLIYSLLINLFISIILLSNTLYLNYYSSPVTISTFYQTTNLSGLGSSILYLFHYQYLSYLVDIIVLPFIFMSRKFFYEKAPSLVKGFSIFFILGICSIALKPVKLLYLNHVTNPIQAYDSLDIVVQYGILGHHALDTYFHIKDANFTLSTEDRKRIKKQLTHDPVVLKVKDHNYEELGKGKNLVLIQMESLQQFVLNKKIEGQEITPTLNKLLKNSLNFPNFYAQTIGGNSSDAEFLSQTSLFPLETGSVFFRYPSNTYHSMGQTLKQQGYSTLAIHADEKTFWNRQHMYPSLGFDDYISIDDFPQNEMIGMGVGDKEMFTETAKILGRQKKPFYSFIVTLTNHMPYEIPDEYKSLSLPNRLENTLLGDYFQTVRYTDEALSLFIDSLKEQNLLEDTIIVIYGDHNGIFNRDKQLLEKWLNKKITNEEWYRTFATVPFILYHPSMKETTQYTIGGQIDIFPTIGSILGLSSDSYSHSLGVNLLSTPDNTAIIPGGGYVEKPFSVHRGFIETGLTDQEKDILETSNLIIKGDYFK